MDGQTIPLLSDLINVIITYSARVAFAIITLALGWIIGRLLGLTVDRIIGKIGLETTFRKTSIGRALLRVGYTPSSFFATLGKGTIYIFAALSALNLLSVPVITSSVENFIQYLPSLVGGILILATGFIFADWIAESIEKGGASSIVQPSLLGGLVRIMLYFMVITISLAQMKVDITILYIFAQAFAWSIAIAIGIAIGWNLKDKISPWLEKMTPNEKKAETAT